MFLFNYNLKLICLCIVALVVGNDLLATNITITRIESSDCESLERFIDSIYINDKSFTKETQAIADILLSNLDKKTCSAYPDGLNLLGLINYNLNNVSKSKEYLFQAEQILKLDKINTKMYVRNLLFSGLMDQTEGNFESAQVSFEKAERISGQIGFLRGSLQANLNLSLCHLYHKDFAMAEEVLIRASQLLEGEEHSLLGGYVYQNMAQINIKQDELDQAELNSKKAFEIWNAIGFQKGLYFCHSNLADIYKQKKDTSLMLTYLHKAVEYTGKDRSFVRYIPYLILGNHYFEVKDTEKAKQYYTDALKQSSSMPEHEILATVNNLYEMYEADNDLEGIKHINSEVIKIYASKSESFQVEAKRWQSKEIELEEKHEENEILKIINFDNLKKIKARNIMLGILFLALNGGLFFFQRFKFKEQLRSKKKTVELRESISRDLHDNVGSILAGISMQAQILERSVGESEKESAIEIADRSREAMSNMRVTVWAMDSRNDNFAALKNKMFDFVNLTQKLKGIQFDFVCDIPDETMFLQPNIRQAAYLIFMESITNISKHSDTKKVDIIMNIISKRLHVSIQDFGSKKEQTGVAGQGLKNMAFRAESNGGTYSFEYNDGYRTEYFLPLG